MFFLVMYMLFNRCGVKVFVFFECCDELMGSK